jgi:hypothetical protein
MKLRTCVLASALLIVPLVAMFSHLVPADVRRMVRAGLWHPVEDAALSLLGGDADQPVPGGLADGREPIPPRTLEPGSPWPSSPAGDVPRGHDATPAVASPPVSQVSFETPPAPPPHGTAATPSPAQRRPASPREVADALVASTRGDWTSHVRGGPAGGVAASAPAHAGPGSLPTTPPTAPAVASGGAVATMNPERESVERQLTDLGAIGFEFVPADAGCPRHRCSCRLPADPSGQLQRVFQAADEDPRAALGQLLTEVKAWQRRAVALTPPAAGASSAVDGVRR